MEMPLLTQSIIVNLNLTSAIPELKNPISAVWSFSEICFQHALN